MRLSVALSCLLLVGCTGPHSTGALWARQNLEQETAMFRLGNAQRAALVQAYEWRLADETLAAERARIETGLQGCPGTGRQPMAVSSGDRSRDSVRIRAQDDSERLKSLAQIALADWRLRRALEMGDARFCDDARLALDSGNGSGPSSGQDSTGGLSDLLSSAGTLIVSRDPLHGVIADAAWPASVALSSYALGDVDTVQARAPLPQYLAAVYGGVLEDARPASSSGTTPEELVDQLAPAHPEWEPDALYAALIAQ